MLKRTDTLRTPVVRSCMVMVRMCIDQVADGATPCTEAIDSERIEVSGTLVAFELVAFELLQLRDRSLHEI